MLACLVPPHSPIGDAFRQRLRMFPSLVNCCTIDWFREWPNEALKSVAYNFYNDVEMESDDLLTVGMHDTIPCMRGGGQLARVVHAGNLRRVCARITLCWAKHDQLSPGQGHRLLRTEHIG